MYECFQYFFRDGWPPWRVVLIASFSLFLVIPLYGHPNSLNPEINSILVALIQNPVLLLSLVAVAETNRRIDPKLRRSGQWVLLLVAVPLTLISLSSFSTLAFGSVPRWILRAMSSLALVVPLLIVIAVLVESIVRTRYGARIPRLPLLLAFASIFLIMYTFATFCHINDLLEGPGGCSDGLR
jgi:cytochrome bd-type quinol oxidase subunit 2